MKIDQYGNYFVEKDQSFHVFYDVFCEFRQVKNNRRVNRDRIPQLIGLTNRRNIVDSQKIAISRQKSADFDDMG